MAYYNMNKVIQLTRTAMGMRQHEVCHGICSTVELSRIENGKNGVRKENFRKLMARMGRTAEQVYAVCVGKDGDLLREREELERALKRFDYDQAEEYLNRMRERADDNVLTMQYIARDEALIDYHKGRINAEGLRKRIDGVIRMTVPGYEKFLNQTDRVFPFVLEELLVLLSLENAYVYLQQYDMGKKINSTILQCLNAGYMLNPDRLTMEITVRRNLAKIYTREGKYVEALKEIEDCMTLSVKIDYGHMIAPLLVSKAFNYIWMVKQEQWPENQLKNAAQYLRQAYYITAARGDAKLMDVIKDYYQKHFGYWG